MLVRVGAATWLVVLCSSACGGNTVASKPDAAATAGASSSNTAGSSGSNTAGSASTAGSGSTNTAGTSSVDPAACSGPQAVCVQRCQSLDRVVSDCVGPQYRCPDGWVDLDSCRKDACARRAQNCCSKTGHVDFPNCAADGSIGECPAGFEQRAPCLPEGVAIMDCAELMSGDACSSAELVCYTGRCSRNCYCKPDATGTLSWACSALPC